VIGFIPLGAAFQQSVGDMVATAARPQQTKESDMSGFGIAEGLGLALNTAGQGWQAYQDFEAQQRADQQLKLQQQQLQAQLELARRGLAPLSTQGAPTMRVAAPWPMWAKVAAVAGAIGAGIVGYKIVTRGADGR